MGAAMIEMENACFEAVRKIEEKQKKKWEKGKQKNYGQKKKG